MTESGNRPNNRIRPQRPSRPMEGRLRKPPRACRGLRRDDPLSRARSTTTPTRSNPQRTAVLSSARVVADRYGMTSGRVIGCNPRAELNPQAHAGSSHQFVCRLAAARARDARLRSTATICTRRPCRKWPSGPPVHRGHRPVRFPRARLTHAVGACHRSRAGGTVPGGAAASPVAPEARGSRIKSPLV